MAQPAFEPNLRAIIATEVKLIAIHSILIYCTIYAIAIIIPGPGILAIVARALKGGVRGTIPAIMGNMVGHLVMMTLSTLGLAILAREIANLFLAVKLAGAGYLIYLGYRYWTAPIMEVSSAAEEARRGFLSQLALTIGNPKVIVLFAAPLPTVIDLRHLRLTGYLELCACTIVLIPSIQLLYAILAARVRPLLSGITARKRMNKAAGIMMVSAGVGVIAS